MKHLKYFFCGVGLIIFSDSGFAMNPVQLSNPCLSDNEAKTAISANKNKAKIFDRSELKKIIINNEDALLKLDKIKASRVLVMPITHLGLKNQCQKGAQVYFAFVDESKELRSRHSMINRTKKAATNLLNKTKKFLSGFRA